MATELDSFGGFLRALREPSRGSAASAALDPQGITHYSGLLSALKAEPMTSELLWQSSGLTIGELGARLAELQRAGLVELQRDGGAERSRSAPQGSRWPS